jgi:hypothetical protein
MDFDKTLLDPASAFDHPTEVVDSAELSREQKIQVLRRWEYDARELQVADEEGMTAPKPQAITLDMILAALRALGAPTDVEHSATDAIGSDNVGQRSVGFEPT